MRELPNLFSAPMVTRPHPTRNKDAVVAGRNPIKLSEVQERTALSRGSICVKVAAGTFPR